MPLNYTYTDTNHQQVYVVVVVDIVTKRSISDDVIPATEENLPRRRSRNSSL